MLLHFKHLNGRSLVSRNRQSVAIQGRRGERTSYLRDLSCLLRCSLLLKARLQNWHLYFFSGTSEGFRPGAGEAATAFMAVTGIVAFDSSLQDDEVEYRLGSRAKAWRLKCDGLQLMYYCHLFFYYDHKVAVLLLVIEDPVVLCVSGSW